VTGGFAEIGPESISLLAEQAVPRGDLTQEEFTALLADAKARLDKAKEVFVSLVGIFGTILGFYFGSVGEQQRDQVTEDATLLGMARLGIVITDLDLTQRQLTRIDAIIATDASADTKKEQINKILDEREGEPEPPG
ncbi:MAG: hypothetical protein AAGK00_20460, partial [Pseudomonadota bacterium]